MLAWIVFLPFVMAILSYILAKRSEAWRNAVIAAAVVIEFALTLLIWGKGLRFDLPYILGGSGLHFMTDGFRCLYALVTSFMWLCTTFFSREYFLHEKEGLDHYGVFVLMTLGATEGVMLSADLLTTFVFFEILSFTSFTWVIHEENKGAIRAGYTYLFIAVIGGLVLLMGLLLLQNAAGTLAFEELSSAVAASGNPGRILAAAICILFGFGCKAGMFPVHIWLPKAHPVAPSPASALLSGVLTKVGVYGILMTTAQAMLGNRFYGILVLCLGLVTMALGAVLALFSVNLKRTLACSSMSQIGFILTGIGMLVLLAGAEEEEGMLLASSGIVLHMLNHSLIKLTLFMAAGVVVMNLETLTLDDIRGWGRNKWPLKIAFALGALGISGVPLFNGYISKTLLHESIVEGIHACEGLGLFLHVSEWIFLISGGLTFAYMLKLFICIFVQKNTSRQEEYDRSRKAMNPLSTVVICGSSLLMVVLGRPEVMTSIAAIVTGNEEIRHFKAFSLANLKGGCISLTIGLLVYLFIVRLILIRQNSYVNLWPEKLDLEDLVYRPLLTRVLPGFFGTLMSFPGENRILRPLCGGALKGLQKVAALFGENLVLRPLCGGGLKGLQKAAALFGENMLLQPVFRGVMFLGAFVGRCMDSSMDGLVVFARRTFMRETRVVSLEQIRADSLKAHTQEAKKAAEPLLANFSFAMMMTCIGIILILGVLVFYIVT